MRFPLLLLVLLTASCNQTISQASYNARIGVAVRLNDRVCMAIRNPKLLPSATIILIAPANAMKNIPAYSARAEVLAGHSDVCPGTNVDAGINSYNLQITSGSVEPNLPLLALDARVPSVFAAHSFHVCDSANRVELTAWDGAKPLECRLLWHQFYTLGERTDATCTAAETVPY